MLAVPNTPLAVAWYEEAFGARLLWNLGSVAAMEIDGAPFLLHEPVARKFASPDQLGVTTARIEVFVDDPDSLLARAMEAGGESDGMHDYEVPWGIHRQGGCIDPWGHRWQIGDKSPLQAFPPRQPEM